MNSVQLIGRLTKNPELRYTQTGIAVVTFTVAVNRNFTDGSGNRQADFILCQAWRQRAELIANSFSKGSMIGLTGSIVTENWEDQQGKRQYSTKVQVDNVDFLESKEESDRRKREQGNTQQGNAPQNNGYGNAQQNNGYGNAPQNNGYGNQNDGAFVNQPPQPAQPQVNEDPFASAPAPNVNDDDLPF